MRYHIDSPVERPGVALISNVVYTNTTHWFGMTSRPLSLDLILPKDCINRTPRPLLVWVCGGGFVQMDRGIWLPYLLNYAYAGYAVASVDYRCAGEAQYPGAIHDVRCAIRFLRAHHSQYGIDPSRIAIMGESAGGYLACMAALGGNQFDTGDWMDQSGDVQAVVDYYGKVGYMDREDDTCKCFVSNIPYERMHEVEPKAFVTPDSPPFLIFHGEDDPLVPIRESEELYEELERQGVQADFYVVNGERHGTDAFYQPRIEHIILNFLDRSLNSTYSRLC